MDLGVCAECGLLQLFTLIDSSLFYTNYATPAEWKREPHVGMLISALDPLISKDSKILDVGCNDGKFLSLLRSNGWRNVSGLEPTQNTADAAMNGDFRVFHRGLNFPTAELMVEEFGEWDCVILRQVLEHIVDLADFGKSLNRLLVDNGTLVIEVPDSRLNLLGADYSVWEEHVNYFTPETLGEFLRASGFEVQTSYESRFSGVCLTVIASKTTNFVDSYGSSSLVERDTVQHQVQLFHEWANAFVRFQEDVFKELSEHSNFGDVVLYGVGSRSSNFVNIMGISGLISYAIDDQPQKQNLFMPGSGIPIVSSVEAASRIDSRTFVLLGVNGENEEDLLHNSVFLREIEYASILPPSTHLLEAWGSKFKDGSIFG